MNPHTHARTSAESMSPGAPARGPRCGQPERALAVVAHELRQPLSVIGISTAVLKGLPRAAGPARIRSIAQTIEGAIAAQRRIIDDLLDLARARTDKLALRRQPVDVGALFAQHVLAFAANTDGCRVCLEDAPAAPLVCDADPLRLGQVAENLLANAVKFTPAGGRVTVRISSEGGYARLTVADTGCGIAPEFLPHVFDLFQQADAGAALHGGLGVGLALVHELVVAHGGFVKAHSQGVGRGAEFSIWLPLSPGIHA